jgi:hypothetical protein
VVERVNQAAARTVLNTYTAEYTALITRLHWPTIAAIAVVDRLRLMYTYVHKSMTTAAAATKTPTTTTIETITQAAAPIWCWVVPEYARRSTRHTNGRQMKVADVSPGSVDRTSRLYAQW